MKLQDGNCDDGRSVVVCVDGVCGYCVDVREQQWQPLTPKLMMTMNYDDHDGDHDDDHGKMVMNHDDHGGLSHHLH